MNKAEELRASFETDIAYGDICEAENSRFLPENAAAELVSICVGQQPAGNSANRPLRILVAEDNPVNQLVVVETLEGAGHYVDVVSNGIEAVNAVQASDYDIVLMDIQMPQLDGISATARIRKLSSGISKVPIVAVTASAVAGDPARYLAAGMDEYLAKPFEADDLFAIITRLTSSGVKPERR